MTPDADFGRELTKNLLRLFIVPEMNRREAAGELPADFTLYAGQILMEPGMPHEIRLNEEVRGVFVLRADSSIEEGTDVSVADFATIAADVHNFVLEHHDRPNCGHMTMILNGSQWFITFDLRYNAARIADHLAAIKEFLHSAEENLRQERLRAFANDLFIAVELMAKSRLMVHPDERLLISRKHTFTISEFNRFAKQGNADKRFASLLNDLAALRNDARYPTGAFTLTSERAAESLGVAREMHLRLLQEIPHRAFSTPTNADPSRLD